MFAQLNDVSTLPARRAGQLTETNSAQHKSGGQLDARYDINNGALDSLKVGVQYVRSTRLVTNLDWTTAVFSDGRTYGSLGFIDGAYTSVYPGKYLWSVPKVDQAALFNVFNTYVTPASFDTCSSLAVNNTNCNTQKGTEDVASAYALLNFKWGNLEVIPGVRFEHTKIDNTFWITPFSATGEQPGHWSGNDTTYSEALPSVFVNYRPSNDTVYRGSIWTSYTRPPFVQLAATSQIHVSADGTTTITQGNPNLKAIKSVNIDLSGEWSNNSGGHALATVFGKFLSNYIYDNGNTLASPVTSGSGLALTTQPTNGGSGHVYGIELAARQKFRDLPAPFDGFGIGANVTRQTTAVDLKIAGLDNPEQIQNAPRLMANAELFYEKFGVSLDLAYHYAGAYISQYDYMNLKASWDDLWIRPVHRVDLHAGYNYNDRMQVDLSVANLFDNVTYWSHVGENSLALSDIVDSGRTTLLTVKFSF
jgi:TonB-dependent receptor